MARKNHMVVRIGVFVISALGLLLILFVFFISNEYASAVLTGGNVHSRSWFAKDGSAWLPVDTSPPGRPSVFRDPIIPSPPPVPAVKLLTNQDGLYVLYGRDLAQVPGWNSLADPRTFHLLRRGQSIPIWVEGAEDGHFDPNDRLLFYGEKRHGSAMFTKYGDTEVYWLTWGGTPGPRVHVQDARPRPEALEVTSTRHIAHFEQDVEWFTHHGLNSPTRNTWWWVRIRPSGHPLTATFPLTLSGYVPGTPVFITYDVMPRTHASPHHIRLSVGNTELDEWTFTGHTYRVFTTSIPAQVIDGEVLHINLRVDPVPGLGMEDLYLNGFTVTYTRTLTAFQGALDVHFDLARVANVRLAGFTDPGTQVWDVTHVNAPVLLKSDLSATPLISVEAGHHHIVAFAERALLHPDVLPYTPREYRHVAHGADEIIIAHPNVWHAAQRLAHYRQTQGYRVALINVESLYDEFGWGWRHPEAIRAFLAYAYEHWPRPAPRYVLLFGDGHWNFKALNTERYGPLPPNLIPPYLAWVDIFQGEVPVDMAYGLVQGNDNIPDLIVGRIPVQTESQAEAVVDKIIAYERGDWQASRAARSILFVSDNPDRAGNFPQLVENVVQEELPIWAHPIRVYLAQTVPDATAARSSLFQALNQGVLLLFYQGHGAINRWTHEAILTTQDVSDLSNAVWPIVATFNCLDGYFAYPSTSYEAIAELMLRREKAGSIAAFSPAGLSVPVAQTTLAHAFLSELVTGHPKVLGDVVNRARLHLRQGENSAGLYFTQTLIGDPLLHLSIPSTMFFPALEVGDRQKLEAHSDFIP